MFALTKFILKNSGKEHEASEFLKDNAGYRKLGLIVDDLRIETPQVLEAIRRLPEAQQIERIRRIKVAFDLNLKQQILPKEKWTKPFEDVPYP
jgi:ubiquinol-cytochrome c reductase subunit 7